jgi:hypothetical protein
MNSRAEEVLKQFNRWAAYRVADDGPLFIRLEDVLRHSIEPPGASGPGWRPEVN